MGHNTYTDIDLDALGLAPDTEAYLESRVATIKSIVDAEFPEIEEGPPSIDGRRFTPGGWVGEFAPGVEVEPKHLAPDEFEQLVADVQDWSEILGPDTIASSLRFSPDLLLDQKARLAPYSRALESVTEQVLAHRLPVRVEHHTERRATPRGRIDVTGTLQERAKRSGKLSSRRTEFHLDSLPNLILVRFHTLLVREFSRLVEAYAHYRESLQDRLAYHRSVLDREPFEQLIEPAINASLTDPDTIDEARAGADDDFAYVIDLWEGFLQDVNLEASLSADFESAIKPMSKTYELWILRHILDVVGEIAEVTPTYSGITGTYRIGDFTVRYDQSPTKPAGDRSGEAVEGEYASRYFKPNLNTSVGRPDFAVSYQGETTWIGDAKFKAEPRRSDIRQVLSYAVDLIPDTATGQALLLYPDSSMVQTGGPVQHYELLRSPFHPGHIYDSRDRLRESIRKAAGLLEDGENE